MQRHVSATKRLLGVPEAHLGDKRWIMGNEYTIADIALFGWVRTNGFCEVDELVEWSKLKNVPTAVIAVWRGRPCNAASTFRSGLPPNL